MVAQLGVENNCVDDGLEMTPSTYPHSEPEGDEGVPNAPGNNKMPPTEKCSQNSGINLRSVQGTIQYQQNNKDEATKATCEKIHFQAPGWSPPRRTATPAPGEWPTTKLWKVVDLSKLNNA
jgi:hypothetical protein